MLIDCDTCQAPSSACADCVMTVLLQVRPRPVDLDPAEAEALGALAGVGLVPPLRLVVGVDADEVSPGAGARSQVEGAVDAGWDGSQDDADVCGGSRADRDEGTQQATPRRVPRRGIRGIA